ncbi:MAG: dockerin type I domain-containing protein [Patescibacteria group bacterium]
MFTVIADVLKGIGLLFQLLWEETATFAEPYWRALKRFLLYGTLVPFVLFILGFVFRSTILLTLGGIFLCLAFVLVTLAFTPLIALIGKFLKKDDQAGSRFIKTILSIWLWELLTVFYCVVFPVWNDYRSLLLVALCALILSLASVVWGVGYITWFRKVLVALVALAFVFCTVSFFLPATAKTLRKMLPNFDQYLNRLLSTKRASGDLIIADINRDGYLDSLDVKWLNRFVADPKLMPDSTRGDINGDSKIDTADVKYLEDYLYAGGWPPRLPKPKPVPVEKIKKSTHPPSIGILNSMKVPLVGMHDNELRCDTFQVAANTRFSGLVNLHQGQWFRIEASGTWDCSGPKAPQPDLPCSPGGLDAPSWLTAHDLSLYPVRRGKIIHNLIGQIGNGVLFEVNSQYESMAPTSGLLMVGPNDWDFADNDGVLSVVVSTRVNSEQVSGRSIFIDTTIEFDTHQPFWTMTSIEVPASKEVRIEVVGQFHWDSGVPNPVVGPEGAPWLASTAGYPEQFLVPNANVVCLLAKVGEQIITIGSGNKFVSSTGGNLQLAINERWLPGRWDDNSGTLSVHVKIS